MGNNYDGQVGNINSRVFYRTNEPMGLKKESFGKIIANFWGGIPNDPLKRMQLYRAALPKHIGKERIIYVESPEVVDEDYARERRAENEYARRTDKRNMDVRWYDTMEEFKNNKRDLAPTIARTSSEPDRNYKISKEAALILGMQEKPRIR